MKRGFKTWSEKKAVQLRNLLQMGYDSPLMGSRLADYMEVKVISPKDVVGLSPSDLKLLLSSDRDSWSAGTVDISSVYVIILNSSHSTKRRESSLMHELAHLICEHPPSTVIERHSFLMRSYNKNQEDEATWLGGCLQIPRRSLIWALRKGMNNWEIGEYFGASIDLVVYRRRTTGVDHQLSSTSKRGGGFETREDVSRPIIPRPGKQ